MPAPGGQGFVTCPCVPDALDPLLDVDDVINTIDSGPIGARAAADLIEVAVVGDDRVVTRTRVDDLVALDVALDEIEQMFDDSLGNGTAT
jgi:hypothetical protein